MTTELVIGDQSIPVGRTQIELPLPPLYVASNVSMPVHIIRGKKPGPIMFISAAVHGDELNGTEIIRRVLNKPALNRLAGTLIAVPVVNVYGVITRSRYLPDRRDLNRCFPGSESGSLAARLADMFLKEIVSKCTHGIDLHTGAINRTNLPQIRANLDHADTLSIAEVFNVPVLLNSSIIAGSLRQAAAKYDIPVLIYEAGEALRYDEVSIRAGVKGIINVMRKLNMLTPSRKKNVFLEPFVARSSFWLRAQSSGLFRKACPLGNRVKRGEVMGFIDDPFSGEEWEVIAPHNGIVIGCIQTMLVHEGEALFHIARFEDVHEVASNVDLFQTEHNPEPVENVYEPPIV